MKWLALLLCRLLVVGPVLKWLALFITVPTTCSRPSIEMVGFMYVCISPCSLPWPDRYILLAQIWHLAPLAPSNDHLRIRFLIWHIMPHLWHISRFALQWINAAIQKYEIYMKKKQKNSTSNSSSRIFYPLPVPY